MKFLFNTIFFDPLYNLLVFLSSIIPGGDAGIAIILLTILVKLALTPLAHKQIVTQRALTSVEPKLAEIKEKHKGEQEVIAKKMMALYAEHGINPFSGFLLLLIQIPIVLALYFVSQEGINLTSASLYSFTPLPAVVNTIFLGILDISKPSLVLAILTTITQFFQMKFSLPPIPKKKEGETPSFKDDLARSMHLQMKYFIPVLIGFVSLSVPAGLPLYWVTSSIFAIGHELIVRRKALEIK
ncbi:MAG: YidC/Oxa1 family membrane protein insertase [Patescibacteria group bacterium]